LNFRKKWKFFLEFRGHHTKSTNAAVGLAQLALSRAKPPAKALLKHGEEACPTQGAARPLVLPQQCLPVLLRYCGQKRPPAVGCVEERRHADQAVVAAGEMGTGAAP
jgi:hypothetical protein